MHITYYVFLCISWPHRLIEVFDTREAAEDWIKRNLGLDAYVEQRPLRKY